MRIQARGVSFRSLFFVCGALLLTRSAFAQSCVAPDPANRPQPAQQYFMVVVDTSGSMTTPVAISNSCGYPNDRFGHARCAVKHAFANFSDKIDFGLAQFAIRGVNVTNPCFGNFSTQCFPGETNPQGVPCAGCGPKPGDATTRAGARILVGIASDNLLTLTPYVDNSCLNPEVGPPTGATPLNGALRDMKRYLANSWRDPFTGVVFLSPLFGNTLACRRINVLLVTDGDETCDSQTDAVNAARDLYVNGVTVGGIHYTIRTFVVNFAGGSIANTDAIAAAGGTGTSLFATNETQLSQSFNSILARPPELDNGIDDDCNGCIDDGISHLSLQKAVSRSTVRLNGEMTYTITAGNTGPTHAAATIDDPLPGSVTLTSFNFPSDWTCTTPVVGATGTIHCTNANFGLNAPAVFTVGVRVSAPANIGSTIANTATFSVGFGAAAPQSRSATTLVVSNQPPVANAGANQSLAAGSTCTADANLDGSASTDPDGDALTYTWSRLGFLDLTGPAQTVNLGPGSHTFTLTVTDGNGGSNSSNVTILVTDTIRPAISVPPAITVANHPGQSCGAVIASSVLGTATGTDNCGTPVISRQPAGDFFPVGTTVVTWAASDGVTPPVTGTQLVTVNDTVAPTIAAPSAVNVSTTPDATTCDVLVTDQQLGVATASDGCPGLVPITRSGVPAGNRFALGSTTVRYIATDAAGNTAVATQIVNVTDGTNPKITAPNALNVTTGPNAAACGAVVPDSVLGSASASDNCAGVSVSRSGVPAGGVFSVGTTTVTYTATDGAGNTAVAAQTVTVRDDTPPVLTLRGGSSIRLSCRAPFSDPGATALDNCDGDRSPAISKSGTVDATTPGTYKLTYSVRDAAGNPSSVERTVTVEDDAPPVITSASVTPTELWPPNHRMMPVSVSVSASDVCSGSAQCSILSVSSNEPVNGLGDGDQAPDWQILSPTAMLLRAERAGIAPGRIYTITLRCMDSAGQSVDTTVTVRVPHQR